MDLLEIKGEIKSPLRYPGGKSKAIKQILPLIPPFKEFREPFVGGGSVFIALKQRVNSELIYKINDLNTDLYCLWKIARDRNAELVCAVKQFKEKYPDGKKLEAYLKSNTTLDEFERAVRFFILNRITFSGLADSGGYSQQAFNRRFTDSSIQRLAKIAPLLKSVSITNEDYENLVLEPGANVFIFLDPPYLQAAQKRLYGKAGDLHLAFDHQRFAAIMRKCPHKWLITYDDSKDIRKLFSFAQIAEWELQYGMNNYMQTSAKKGKELFISNYDLKSINNSSFLKSGADFAKYMKIRPLDYFIK